MQDSGKINPRNGLEQLEKSGKLKPTPKKGYPNMGLPQKSETKVSGKKTRKGMK